MNPRFHRMLAGVLVAACSLGIAAAGHAQTPKVLKISHQFPLPPATTATFATASRRNSRPRWRSGPRAS